MTLLFLSLQISVPVFLRFYLHRTVAPFYARFVAFFQDLFVVSLLCFFSIPVAALIGFLIHIYIVFDAFLFNKMKIRMRFSYCLYLRDGRNLFHSAKEMGLYRFLWITGFLFLGHGLGTFFYRELDLKFSWIASVSLGVVALGSILWLPKSTQYAVNHPFFLKQWASSQKKSLPSFFPTLQSGPKVFEIRIDPEEKPHFVFLFLESFPAKYVGPETTPHLHRLIKEGIFFSNFYSNGTLTYRALLSGLFGAPPGSTATGLSPYVEAPLKGIPHVLKKKGYKTAFHHNGSLRYDKQESFLKKHFDEIADKNVLQSPFSGSMSWGIEDEILMQYSANWLEKQKEPTFLTLFTISNHHPWIVPGHYKAPQTSRFLQTVHYTDFAFNGFIEHLRSKNLSQKTILFILGDHGQPMGEHQGNFYNSRFLYEENVHIPLLILADGRISQPTVIDEVGSQIDLLPTVIDLLGMKEPCFGASLLRRASGKTAFLQNPYSEGFWGCRQGPWKWIENCLSSQEELYNLQQDPSEENDLSSSHPQIAEALKNQTRSFFAQMDDLYRPNVQQAASPYCLDFSNAMIRDRELEDLASPYLYRVNLGNCMLLTDQGLSSFFSLCPDLEELNLKGVTDVTGEAFKTLLPRLTVLDLSDAADISLERITQCCPNLRELSWNAKNACDFTLCNLTRLKLFEAHQITDDIMIVLFKNNPYLGRLVMHGCTQLTDRTLFALKQLPLEMLWLFDAPQITDQGRASLSQLPIRSLILGTVK